MASYPVISNVSPDVRQGTRRALTRVVMTLAYLAVLALTALPQHASARDARTPALPCGDVLAFQILLDKRGFSPGEIDGRLGANAAGALSTFQDANKLPTCTSRFSS